MRRLDNSTRLGVLLLAVGTVLLVAILRGWL